MRRHWKEALKRQVVFYLAVIAFSIFLPSFTLNFINRPKKEELFTVFIASRANGREKIDEFFDSNKPDYVRKVAINLFSNDDPNFNLYYSSFGLKHSDLILVPENRIKDPDITTYCCALSEPVIAEYGFSSFYEINSLRYGVKLNDGTNDIDHLLDLNKEGEEKEDYYMFVSKDSYHIGELGKSEKETAFAYMNLLLNYEEE